MRTEEAYFGKDCILRKSFAKSCSNLQKERKVTMKKNKILTVCSLLAVSVVLLTACGKKNNGNTGENTESTTPQTSSQAGNNTGNTPAESTEPAQESRLMYLRDAVAEALGEDYWPDSVMEPEYVQDLYGLKPDMYEDIFVETPMIGTNVDTLIIVHAKKDRVEDVEKALNTYRESEINNTNRNTSFLCFFMFLPSTCSPFNLRSFKSSHAFALNGIRQVGLNTEMPSTIICPVFNNS